MNAIIIATLLAAVFAQEMLVTKEYTDYLKKHVSWEVVEYEDNIFRGFTVDEASMFYGAVMPENDGSYVPSVAVKENLPSSVSWMGASCNHEVRAQGDCGSCWAFATVGMLSDLCCMQGSDHGWLSVQELVSCDRIDLGCRGGWPSTALNYIVKNNGLVPETCFPYRGISLACPSKCVNGKEWAASHTCTCEGGYKTCNSIAGMKSALQTGPIVAALDVCRSLHSYKSGVYMCDCSRYEGLHTVEIMGYSYTPVCNFIAKNSWGSAWGVNGYISIGCDQCGINGKYPQGNVMCEKVH